MKIPLLFSLLSMLIISPMFADELDPPKKRYTSRSANGHKFTDSALLNDSLILNFVSHPKAWNHFVNGQKEMRELAFKLKDKVEELKVKYPEHPEVCAFRDRFMHDFYRFENPLPFEEIVAPLVVLGIGDTSTITNLHTLGDVQTIQIKIFKNWLARYRIGRENPNFLFEMREYANRSSLDLFQRILRPIFNAIEDYDDIMNVYIADERAHYADEHQSEFKLSPEAEEALAREIERSLAEIFPPLSEESELDKIPDEATLVIEQEIEAFLKEISSSFDIISKKYYSRDAIILLFLEINGLLDH